MRRILASAPPSPVSRKHRQGPGRMPRAAALVAFFPPVQTWLLSRSLGSDTSARQDALSCRFFRLPCARSKVEGAGAGSIVLVSTVFVRADHCRAADLLT